MKYHYDHTYGENRLNTTLIVRISNSQHATSNEFVVPKTIEMLYDDRQAALKDGMESALDAGPALGLPLVCAKVEILANDGETLDEVHPTTLQVRGPRHRRTSFTPCIPP